MRRRIDFRFSRRTCRSCYLFQNYRLVLWSFYRSRYIKSSVVIYGSLSQHLKGSFAPLKGRSHSMSNKDLTKNGTPTVETQPKYFKSQAHQRVAAMYQLKEGVIRPTHHRISTCKSCGPGHGCPLPKSQLRFPESFMFVLYFILESLEW